MHGVNAHTHMDLLSAHVNVLLCTLLPTYRYVRSYEYHIMRTRVRARARACACACVRVRVRVCVHLCVCVCARARACICGCAYAHACACLYTTLKRARIHTNTHTHTHTHTLNTHTHTHRPPREQNALHLTHTITGRLGAPALWSRTQLWRDGGDGPRRGSGGFISARQKFSKVPYIVNVNRKWLKALTFQNFCQMN